MTELTITLSPIAIEWLKEKAKDMGYGNDLNRTASALLEMQQIHEKHEEEGFPW